MAETAAYDGPDRRSEPDPFGGLPTWAKVAGVVGIPGVIAFFTVYVGFTTLPKLQAELMALRLEAERSRLVVQQQVTQDEQIYRILQRICSELAKTDESRARCFDR